jgi:hypothetical protein
MSKFLTKFCGVPKVLFIEEEYMTLMAVDDNDNIDDDAILLPLLMVKIHVVYQILQLQLSIFSSSNRDEREMLRNL